MIIAITLYMRVKAHQSPPEPVKLPQGSRPHLRP